MVYPTKLMYHFIGQAPHYLTYAQIHAFIYLIILITLRNEALLIPILILFFFGLQQLRLFELLAILHHD